MVRIGGYKKRARLSVLCAAVIVVAAALTLTGCPEKGPGQKVGEKIDAAKDKVSDTLDPKGPVEKAGRSIDKATGN